MNANEILKHVVEFGSSSLFNVGYYCEQNECTEEAAAYNFARSITEGVWRDFHPLVCKEDFENSGTKSLAEFVGKLFNINSSLQETRLVFFHSGLYRGTVSALEYENELIDYLVNGPRTGGLPHPFCDMAYASLIGSIGAGPYRYGDAWSQAVGMWPNDAPQMSPFFDAYDFNHRLSLSGLLEEGATDTHPLRLFYYKILPVDFHKQLIYSCLSFAFKKGDIFSHFSPHFGWQVVDILAEILMFKSESPIEVRTSVCILNFNKLVHSYFCAVSAAVNSDDSVEVILFDNGSQSYESQHLLNLLRNHKKVRIIRSKKNLFFGEGNNVAKDFAVGDYIYFLNNDAYVNEDTIDSITHHMNHSAAAAAGCTFLFPNGYVQEVGGIVSDCGQQIQKHKNSSLVSHFSANWDANYQNTQYISSANFCIRRDVLEEIGGYDYIYEPLYFEDTDLCKRITETGREIHLLPNTFVVHVENASTREFLGEKFISQIEKNRAIFKKRWEYKPLGYVPRDISAYTSAFKRSGAGRLRAYVYSPYPISVGGGERYILSVVRALSSIFDVTFFVPGFLSKDRIAFVMSDLGITLKEGSCLSLRTLDELYTSPNPDVMIVMGNEIVPPIPMVGRLNIHHCQFPFPAQNEDRFEFWRLDNVDAVLVNSSFTADSTRRNLQTWRKEIPVEVISPPVQVSDEVDVAKNFANGTIEILSVGRFDPHGHSKNQHLIIEIFNKFSESHPNARLNLVGGCSGVEHQVAYIEYLKSISGPNINIIVNAPREELNKHLRNAHFYIHACGYGSSISATPEKHEHFGISVVEAMSHGCIPLVYDSGGPAEIVKGGLGSVYRTVKECVSTLSQLTAMEASQLNKISAACVDASQQYSDEQFDARVLDLVTNALRSKAGLPDPDFFDAQAVESLPKYSVPHKVEESPVSQSLETTDTSHSRVSDALWCARYARFRGVRAALQAYADIRYLRRKGFNESFYKADPRYQNPKGMDPLVHYVLIGAYEGISPDFRFKPSQVKHRDEQDPYVTFLKSN